MVLLYSPLIGAAGREDALPVPLSCSSTFPSDGAGRRYGRPPFQVPAGICAAAGGDTGRDEVVVGDSLGEFAGKDYSLAAPVLLLAFLLVIAVSRWQAPSSVSVLQRPPWCGCRSCRPAVASTLNPEEIIPVYRFASRWLLP